MTSSMICWMKVPNRWYSIFLESGIYSNHLISLSRVYLLNTILISTSLASVFVIMKKSHIWISYSRSSFFPEYWVILSKIPSTHVGMWTCADTRFRLDYLCTQLQSHLSAVTCTLWCSRWWQSSWGTSKNSNLFQLYFVIIIKLREILLLDAKHLYW